MLRLLPELPSVRHTPHLPHASLRYQNPQTNTMQWHSPIPTVSTVALLNPRWARATIHHPIVRRLLQLPPPVSARPLVCLAQGCVNLAQAVPRCSEPTAPPGQWRCLHHCNITETVAGVSASDLTPRSTQETKAESPAEAAATPLLPTSGRASATNAPPHLLRPVPRRSQHRYQHRPLGVPSVPCHCCTYTRPTSNKPPCFATETPPPIWQWNADGLMMS